MITQNETNKTQTSPNQGQGELGQLTNAEILKMPLAAQGALWAHRNGFQVFPVAGILPDGSCTCSKGASCTSQGKHPVTAGWKEFKFINEDLLRQYWQLTPSANYAINCNGLVVIDVDNKNDGFKNYEQHILPLIGDIKTLTLKTGSGGRHIVFRSNTKFKNYVGLVPGVDIRNDGGLIIGPGSLHKSGNRYSVLYGGTDKTDEVKLSHIPDALEAFILKFDEKPSVAAGGDSKAILAFGEQIPDGMRNRTLFTKGCQLREKGLTLEEIYSVLSDMNTNYCEIPIEDDEITKIVESISRYDQGGEIKWEDPILDYSLKERVLADIDENCIPDFYRGYVVKRAKALGVPVNAVLVYLLTFISSILGAAYKVTPIKDSDFEITLNLWGMLVAPPSSKKTPIFGSLENVFRYICDFYNDKRISLFDENQKAIEKLNTDRKVFKKDKEDVKLAEADNELARLRAVPIPSYIFAVNDTSPEALAEAFKHNARGILFYRDELSGLFNSLVRNGNENLRSMLTESFNGGKSFSLNRIGRGIITVPSMTLSLLGGSQGDVLVDAFPNELLRGKGSDGLLARFQLICSYSSSQIRKFDSSIDLKDEKFKIELLVVSLHELTKDFNMKPHPFVTPCFLAPNAYEAYKKYSDYIHDVVTNENITNQAYRSHIGKFERLVLSLAGQFHVVNSIQNNKNINEPISLEWVNYAISIAQHMDLQIKSLYFSIGKNTSAQALVSKIKSGEIVDGMSIRNIYRHCWSYLATKDAVLSAIEQISDSSWATVKTEIPKGGGHPTEVIKLNPKLIEHLKFTMSKAEKR